MGVQHDYGEKGRKWQFRRPVTTFILSLMLGISGFPAIVRSQHTLSDNDSLMNHRIEELLNHPIGLQLRFPLLTRQTYSTRAYRPLWSASESEQPLASKASALLRSAAFYGLNPLDYHVNEITVAGLDRAREDILLTDAMLSFIVHLHYGKLNPTYSEEKLDKRTPDKFYPDSVLRSAIKDPGFENVILRSQPSFRGYHELTEYLQGVLSRGDWVDYDIINLINLNLERWRWERQEDSLYIAINIPAYRLDVVSTGEIKEEFKVIVGKPVTPTPLLQSDIYCFVTSPDWYVPRKVFLYELLPKALRKPTYLIKNHFFIYDKEGREVVPTLSNLKLIREKSSNYLFLQLRGTGNALGRVVFCFKNPFSLYLHDTPERSPFNQSFRALSYGGIQLENPERLVQLLLDGEQVSPNIISKIKRSMRSGYRQQKYVLRRPVPIRIRYFTCEVKDNVFVRYHDVYQLDQQLNQVITNL